MHKSQIPVDAAVLKAGNKNRIKKAFRAKNASGWSLPLMNANATQVYAKTIALLYRSDLGPVRIQYRFISVQGAPESIRGTATGLINFALWSMAFIRLGCCRIVWSFDPHFLTE